MASDYGRGSILVSGGNPVSLTGHLPLHSPLLLSLLDGEALLVGSRMRLLGYGDRY